MKAVLISIQPYWVFLIIAKAMGWNIDKEKTVEVRKTFPKNEGWNEVAKIYCSKNKKSFAKIPKEYQPLMKLLLGKVVGEFVCDKICKYTADPFISKHIKKQCEISDEAMVKQSCLSLDELYHYESHPETHNWGMFGWHISDLKIYDEPKELWHFFKPCGDCDKKGTRRCTEELSDCRAKTITRPPQSWCYVESLVS